MHLAYSKKQFGFGPQDDPTALLPGEPLPVMIGHRMSTQSYGAGAERQANRYDGTSSCPAGQQVVSHGSTQHAAKYIGGPTSTPYVYCKPIPAAAPVAAPVAPAPRYITTISPTFQQAFTPQISPTIQVTADSPGAQVSSATQQTAPGGQQAEGGSSGGGADLDAIAQLLAEQREFQAAAEARQLEQQMYERARSEERAAADRRERDRIEYERELALEDEERARLEDEKRFTTEVPAPTQFFPIAAPMGPAAAPAAELPSAEPAADDNTALYVALGVGLLLVGGYAYTKQRRKPR